MSNSPYDESEKRRLEEERKHDAALAEQRRKVQVEAEHRRHITQVKVEIERIEHDIQRKEFDLRALQTESFDTDRDRERAQRDLAHVDSSAVRSESEETHIVRDLRSKLDALKEEVRVTEEDIRKHEAALLDAKQKERREQANQVRLQQVTHTTKLRAEDLQKRSAELERAIAELKRKAEALNQELRK